MGDLDLLRLLVGDLVLLLFRLLRLEFPFERPRVRLLSLVWDLDRDELLAGGLDRSRPRVGDLVLLLALLPLLDLLPDLRWLFL